MERLIFATHNPGKLEEMRQLVDGLGIDGGLRALPRPQIRPDSDPGLLFALRSLRQFVGTFGQTASRHDPERSSLPGIFGGAEKARKRVDQFP